MPFVEYRLKYKAGYLLKIVNKYTIMYEVI